MNSGQGTMGKALGAGRRALAEEVPVGYKRTEVGVIPEDWESSCVRAISSSSRNAIVGGPFGSDLVSKDYAAHGVPVIRGQNILGRRGTRLYLLVFRKSVSDSAIRSVYKWRYRPSRCMSAACVPASTILPLLSTTIRSAS